MRKSWVLFFSAFCYMKRNFRFCETDDRLRFQCKLYGNNGGMEEFAYYFCIMQTSLSIKNTIFWCVCFAPVYHVRYNKKSYERKIAIIVLSQSQWRYSWLQSMEKNQTIKSVDLAFPMGRVIRVFDRGTPVKLVVYKIQKQRLTILIARLFLAC